MTVPHAYQVRPIVYMAPDQFVGLDTVTRLLELEPDEVFNDAGVKEALGRLGRLVARRADGPPFPEHPTCRRQDGHEPTERALRAVGPT